jgi:putative intracellular protease/amidase
MRRKTMQLDGNLITSRTPDDLPAFMRTLIQIMGAQSA